ncbi:MAG: Rpn family recombination-promoting nuclease/putative transposase [Akkermansiaceae bacterium]
MENPEEPFTPTAHTHDGFFKSVFSQPEHATAFFKTHLSPAIVTSIDWPSLTVLPGSFVKSSLQQVHSDLLFSVRIGERETLLYLLFEHQSSPDTAMPLRVIGYIVEILTQHHRAHGLPLPPVLPLILHQGPATWNVSTAFEDLFELPKEIAPTLLPFLPKFHHALLDLTSFDPTTGEEDTRMQVVLQLMKLARQKELLRFFQWLAGYSADELPESLLGKMLLYALHSDSDLDAQAIYTSLSSNPELEKSTMSVAEKLIAQGISQGISQGIVQGISQGLWVGKIQSLQEFLGQAVSSCEELETLAIAELEGRHATLHREYETRFKL